MADLFEKETVFTADDFKLVQADKKIFDKKLDTKPTTFFKDSLKRFAKNKSSVCGAIILGILVLLAFIVPMVSPYDVEKPRTDERFLTPKLFNAGFGFWDGTRKYSNITYDTINESPDPEKFKISAVMPGTLKVDENYTYIDTKNPYGRYGFVHFVNESKSASVVNYLRPQHAFEFKNTQNVVYNITMGTEADALGYKLGEYDIVFYEKQEGTSLDYSVEPKCVLVERTNEYKNYELEVTELLKNRVSGFTSLEGYVVFRLYGVDGNNSYILIEKLEVTGTGLNAEQQAFNEALSFDESTKMVAREKNNDGSFPLGYWSCTGRKGLYKVQIKYCSFTYNTYEVPYGDDVKTFAKSQYEKYIKDGHIKFEAPTYEILLANTAAEGEEINGCPYGILETVKYSYNESGDKSYAGFIFRKSKSDTTEYEVTPEEFEEWTEKGYVKYTDFEFEVLDEEKTALQRVNEVRFNTITKKIQEIKGSTPKYKALGYKTMPRFLFGTNSQGQDMFTKAFKGLRTSLILGIITALFCFVFGLCWGSISGYFGGNVDLMMERFCELLSGVPFVVMMTLIMLHFGKTFFTFAVALCLTGWMGTAARTRTQFYRFKGREYVLASRTLGSSDLRLIFRHILPNSLGTIITGSVFMITSVIFSEASLAYIGLGLQGVESFGVMMADNQKYLGSQPYLVIFPACIISLMMISFNLFGNGLRDAVNPSLKGSE